MKRGLAIFGLVVVVAATAAAVFWFRQVSLKVNVVAAEKGPAVEAVYATAVVEPVNWAKIGPTGTSRILELGAKEGDRVTAGQALARLDDRQARARIREIEARMVYLESDVKRLKMLAERDYASRASLELAESELKAKNAALAAARQALDVLVLRAPMDGIVLKRDGEVGEAVGPADTLFWVGREKPLRAEAEVDEEDITRIRTGQRVLIKADAFPGRVLEGKVAKITPKGDPVSKSYRARIALPADTPLLIGMTVEVNVVVSVRENAVLVPPRALDGGRVWVVAGKRARARLVTVGVKGAKRIEVRNGIKPGEMVIVDPPKRLRDGNRVRPRHAPAP